MTSRAQTAFKQLSEEMRSEYPACVYQESVGEVQTGV